MSWIREMEQDAVAVAFPDWEWRDDDVVSIDQQWDDGYHYSSYTYESPSFKIGVYVHRAGAEGSTWDRGQARSYEYSRDEAAEFWASLMKRGSER